MWGWRDLCSNPAKRIPSGVGRQRQRKHKTAKKNPVVGSSVKSEFIDMSTPHGTVLFHRCRWRSQAWAGSSSICRSCTGFTLIELLTVIVIIGILAAFLIGLTSRARERAEAVNCVQNMRTIHSAVMLYVGDNDGLLPGPCIQNQNYRDHFTGQGYMGFGSKGVTIGSFVAGYFGHTPDPTAVQSFEPFVCPSQQRNLPAKTINHYSRPTFNLIKKPSSTDMGYPASAVGLPPQLPINLVALAPEWAKLPYLAEVDRVSMTRKGTAPSAAVDRDPAHNGGRHFLFYDGRIEWHDTLDFMGDYAP